jgi:sterol desaturase/sphingolipid hydroxylase (fatty acid hydroxylase superfamily)
LVTLMVHPSLTACYTVVFIVLAVAIARIVEKRWPIDRDMPLRDIVADWKATGVNLGLASLLEPSALPFSAAIVSAFGGGLIHLRIDGVWYVLSLIIYVIALDLTKYWLHRLDHAVPFLWAMHSFHHSAEAITFFTGGRHYWLGRILTGSLLPILPIVFDTPVSMAGIVAFIFFLPDSCAHLNVRLPMGRLITWVNSPQWHRIHHSVHPEHHDKNFAALLPIWDILFGTAWVPKLDEYPATGIIPSEKVGIIDSVVWPFRNYLRR